ncbi:MAG: DUF6491 family protein [Gammaproteobacteria bacterium]|nr:DUF6491 family protein [Gammaproteobacteria bacterium]
MTNLSLCVGACALFCALPAASLPPVDGHTQALAERLLEPVRSIESANQINDWEQLDDQHVVLRSSSQNQYLITLKSRCLGLNWARNVGVTMSNNTIWAGFDAITVDGNQCEIKMINPLESP